MVVNGFVPLSRVSGETEAIPLLKARAEQEHSVGTLNSAAVGNKCCGSFSIAMLLLSVKSW